MRKHRNLSSGQAMVEGLLLMGLLSLFAIVVVLLGRYQQSSLASFNTERLGLFALTRDVPLTQIQTWLQQYQFGGRQQQTNNRIGRTIQSTMTQDISNEELDTQLHLADQLQKEWGIPATLKTLRLSVQLSAWDSKSLDPLLKEHTSSWSVNREQMGAIATGAGHATSHADMSRVVEQAPLAWKNHWMMSSDYGKQITDKLSGADGQWPRPIPDFSWISPWEGRLPLYQPKP